MKITIETAIQFDNPEQYDESGNELLQIIKDISTANDKNEMLANLKYSDNQAKFKHFFWGCGSHHLWMKQVFNNELLKDRFLIVEF